MIFPLSKTALSFVVVILALFAPAKGASFGKRVQSNAPGWDPHSTPFPPVHRGDVVFQYRSEAAKGNVSVPDPYNSFETSNAEDFINSQIAFTKTYLDKLEDLPAMRTAISEATPQTFRPPRGFGPKGDPTYLYYTNEGPDKSGKLHIAKQSDLDEAAKNHFATLPGKVFIDETLLGGEILWYYQISPDGTKLLYSTVDTKTNLIGKMYVRDVSSPLTDKSKPTQEGGFGRYTDVITDLQAGSEAWSGDSKSFFYKGTDTSVKYHVIGTDSKDDITVVQPNKDDQGDWWVQVSKDGKYLVLYGTVNGFDNSSVYVASLDQGVSTSMKWLCIAPDHASSWNYITNFGNDFYSQTSSKDAPNLQVVRFTLDFTKATKTDSSFSTFAKGADSVVVIPQRLDASIAYFVNFDTDKLLIIYEKDNALEFHVFNLKTGMKLQKIDLDVLSTSYEVHASPFATHVYLKISALNSPGQLYDLKWNKDSNQFSYQLVYQQKIHTIDPAAYTVQRLSAPSKAGDVKVPFFALHRKNLKFDGSHPVIINFYAAYGYVLPTWYDSHHMAFVHNYDAVYILAAPRGGDEMGEGWHKAGQLQNKQNTFDDVLSVIQFAIDQKWTSPGKVILNVQSPAALAGAAIVNQAPEGLIGAYIGTQGLYDMLRSDQSPKKATRAAEFGSPSDPKAFDWLREYSPLHNIDPKKTYPTILIYPLDGDADTGGEAWHSFKQVSELQYSLPNNPNPILLGNGTDTQEERSATAFALAAHTLGSKLVE
ncbi:alpha/beta-hydrolase [Meira miltonrushii]|uniref:Prolyl endopeptidase n=1 Tax=Meira miltonrushii TaxID=1280837 RepID=A0A316VH06_9BASI|nr:alpha/beta-hydrolase [Meira miltonrushii]PWN36826.1 alpha/beta-hydrolase [Meira miltonrushii]